MGSRLGVVTTPAPAVQTVAPNPEAVTLEQALELVAAKAPKGGRRAPRKAGAAKSAKGKAKPKPKAATAKTRAPAS